MAQFLRSTRALLSLPPLVAIGLLLLNCLVVGKIQHGHNQSLRLRCVVVEAKSRTPLSGRVVRATKSFPKGPNEQRVSSYTNADGRTHIELDVKCDDTISLFGTTHAANPWPWELRVDGGDPRGGAVRLSERATKARWWEQEIIVPTK
jgi:hypothetical protein